MYRTKIIKIFAFFITILIAVILTYFITIKKYHNDIEFAKNNKQLVKVYNDVKQNFYKEISNDDFEEYMIKGCLLACDEEYCNYFTSNEIREKYVNENSPVSRSGFSVDKNRFGEIVVIKVDENSRAEEMGLKKNDVIVSINGVNVIDKGYYSAIEKLLGKDNTIMNLEIRREGEQISLEFIRNNKYKETDKEFCYKILKNDILYFKFIGFDENLQGNFDKAVKEYSDYKSIILDLRDNHGGDIRKCIQFFNNFYDENARITLEYTNLGKKEVYTTEYKENIINKEIVVLINEKTISSGELFTALFKSTGRAVLIGAQTAGKGIFQNTIFLPNYGTTYSYTAGYTYVNDMPNFEGVGVLPDIEINMDSTLIGTDDDIQLKKAIEILENK